MPSPPEDSTARGAVALSRVYSAAGIAFHPRSPGHIRALLNRWSVQSPGVVRTELWGTGYGNFTGAYAAIALTTTT
ncbi:hypothetical protein [Streptomyces halstedii]|uniref:Uncharacterized protein n=1 Tax=Streptomyces halstedii TaxID=1944 RepID=A0A6N9UA66_STRHA|nr:hypothetical protein [Streptomyces halstedii]NEA20680.1 hypothetical protein [Streptomyces halstedii]